MNKGYVEQLLKNTARAKSHERFLQHDFSSLLTSSLVDASPCEDWRRLQLFVETNRLAQHILLVFVNGFFVPDLSDIDQIQSAFSLQAVASCEISALDEAQYPLGSVSLNRFQDGMQLRVSSGKQTMPVHWLSISASNLPVVMNVKHAVILEEQSYLQLVEEHVALDSKMPFYVNHRLLSILLLREATLSYCKIQREHALAMHYATTIIEQQQASRSELIYFSSGGAFEQEDLIVHLNEPGAFSSAAGLYETARDQAAIFHDIAIHHHAPNCVSDMLYKGIARQQSKILFNGSVLVDRAACHTTATQANHHLLLSPLAEAYSKPVLEINTDDVSCKHGATTGYLDQEALFYLRARGIDLSDAIEILLNSFSAAVLQRVQSLHLKQHLYERGFGDDENLSR